MKERERQKAAKTRAEIEPQPVKQPGKLSALTIRALNALDADMRRAVEAKIREHLRACIRNGSPMEDLDRVWTEAILICQMEAKEMPQERIPVAPFRSYPQYVSPIAEAA